MQYKKVQFCTLLILGLGGAGVKAQQDLPAMGSDASGSGGSVSYSVGQVTYTTNTSLNGSVAQGVQQPYEISVVLNVNKPFEIELDLSSYPNPTRDLLNLKVGNHNDMNLTYQLIDISGKLLLENKINDNETDIVMSDFPVATYFLRISGNDKEIKTFKIIKN